MEINKIYNMDAVEGMKQLPDNSIDYILVDLPYGTTNNEWDKKIPLDSLWEQWLRVGKENVCINLFAQFPLAAELIISQPKLFRYSWVWVKNNPVGFLNAKKMPLRTHELVLTFYRKLPTYNPQKWKGEPYYRGHSDKQCGHNYRKAGWSEDYIGKSEDGSRYPLDVISDKTLNTHEDYATDLLYFKTPNAGGGDGIVYHPTQKPQALCEYLIKTYTSPNDTVLDCCMGSGTTAIAAKCLGRNYIGFELNKEYVDIANKRLSNLEVSLFDI